MMIVLITIQNDKSRKTFILKCIILLLVSSQSKFYIHLAGSYEFTIRSAIVIACNKKIVLHIYSDIYVK